MITSSPSFGVWVDFRNPSEWRISWERLYDQYLEQVRFAEELGFGSVWLTEHHFSSDGYSPSPLTIASAIAASTERIDVGTNLIVLPLHHPLRVAEDSSILSILSHGRFNLGLGLGYRRLEFEAFGKSLQNRRKVMEQGVGLIRSAWAGESISADGPQFRVPRLRISPTPTHPPKLLIGGKSRVAIERAARLGDGFLSADPADNSIYLDAISRFDTPPERRGIYGGHYALIAADPQRAWDRLGIHALHQIQTYRSWGAKGRHEIESRTADDLLRAGIYQALSPDEAVEFFVDVARTPHMKDVHFWMRLPGESYESSCERMEVVSSQVLPRVLSQLEGNHGDAQ